MFKSHAVFKSQVLLDDSSWAKDALLLVVREQSDTIHVYRAVSDMPSRVEDYFSDLGAIDSYGDRDTNYGYGSGVHLKEYSVTADNEYVVGTVDPEISKYPLVFRLFSQGNKTKQRLLDVIHGVNEDANKVVELQEIVDPEWNTRTLGAKVIEFAEAYCESWVAKDKELWSWWQSLTPCMQYHVLCSYGGSRDVEYDKETQTFTDYAYIQDPDSDKMRKILRRLWLRKEITLEDLEVSFEGVEKLNELGLFKLVFAEETEMNGSWTSLSDHIAWLEKLTNMQYLSFEYVGITDDDALTNLKRLAALPSLKEIEFRRCYNFEYTATAPELRKLLPNCEISGG
ncbi:hypothetical protein B0181_02670 [Moraxella caviae]|uniref:Uncharacterized protein n=1 Tax=Moraxella caviae TaxID=34060 RepID=A0A1T0A7J7_9GAMM|nr:hypothetical protein [Moraxella caviae]OOR91667.1 hypothetical protein B0181_02670 [Moraxella caviae]STZ10415.1 Uncharacterised protein [Moraxella caviae]